MTGEEIDTMLDLMGLWYRYDFIGNFGIIMTKDPLDPTRSTRVYHHGKPTIKTKQIVFKKLIGETK